MAKSKPLVTDGAARKARRIMRDLNRQQRDPNERRYHVYRCIDAAGEVLYIGRSCNPLARLRQHHATRGIDWPSRVVQIEGYGPFTWDEVVREERDAIMAARPPFNKDFVVTKTYRNPPLTA